MNLIRISPRGFGANTYVLTDENNNAIVIDPSQPRVESELIKLGIKARYVLLTHCHFDHVGGVSALQQGGAKVYCSTQEKPLVNTSADLFEEFGAPGIPYIVDATFDDNETKTLLGYTVQALLTPGHTAGSVCYLITAPNGEEVLFTGDTLFAGSIGRTDFPTASPAQMRKSLRRLYALEKDYPIYPGHEDSTTLYTERKRNAFYETHK